MGHVPLGHLGLDDDRVQRDQRGDRGALLHPFAFFHVHRVHCACEGRDQRQAVGGGLSLRQRAFGCGFRGAAGGQLGFRQAAFGVQLLAHGELFRRLGQLILRGFHRCAHVFAFKQHHHGAALDGVARLGGQLLHDAIGPRRQNRQLVRLGHARNADQPGIVGHLGPHHGNGALGRLDHRFCFRRARLWCFAAHGSKMPSRHPKGCRDKDHQSQKPVQGKTRDHARSLCKCRHRARRVRRL